MAECKALGEQGTEKKFSNFEEASTYAKEVARQIGLSITVHRIETGWVVTHQQAPDQISDPPNKIRSEPVKVPEKTKKSIEVYKGGNWWFVEGSEGQFSTEEQANKAADVIRRCQSGKTTGLPATVDGDATKQRSQGNEKRFSKFEEPSIYSSRELSRKPRKPQKAQRKKSINQAQPKQTRSTQPIGSEDRLCVDCGELIPKARVAAVPDVQRCTKCQSLVERRDPAITKRKIDEGLAGSRDDNKKMRARQWGDMMSRHRK